VITLQASRLGGGYGPRQVVGPVDLEIEAGTCLGILGPNGAGKSTLLRLLAGILPARAGNVLLLGRSLTAWRRREAAQVVGFVPQSLSVAFPLTVLEMVMQGRAPHLGAWQPAGPADEAAVEAALAEVGLGARRNVGVHTMSGGERQLVLLARALAGQPRLLLMDEPATGLDVRHQLALVDTVRRSCCTTGTSPHAWPTGFSSCRRDASSPAEPPGRSWSPRSSKQSSEWLWIASPLRAYRYSCPAADSPSD
jgi:iron complex transport system ATP-binding protein